MAQYSGDDMRGARANVVQDVRPSDSNVADRPRIAWAHGLATVSTPPAKSGVEPQVLDVWYPFPEVGEPGQTQAPVGFEAPEVITEAVKIDQAVGTESMVIFTAAKLNEPPVDVADVYLRLTLLAEKLVAPDAVNLTGWADILPVVAWTNIGPCPPKDIEQTIKRVRAHRGLQLKITDVAQVRPALRAFAPTTSK